MRENLGIAVLYVLLRELLWLREDRLPKPRMSWGLAIAEAVPGFLELAMVCAGFLRSLQSHCVIEGCWTAAPYSSALFALMVMIYKISASFIPESSGYFAHVQSCLAQRRCIPWCQQDAGMKRDH